MMGRPLIAVADDPGGLAAPLLELERLVDALVSVIMAAPPGAYVARPFAAASGSIGEHVRHAIDHIGALVGGRSATILSYDRRERGGAVEWDPGAALRQLCRVKAALAQWAAQAVDAPIQVVSQVSPSGAVVTGWSTVARELAFVISHTIHHQALIALLLEAQGLVAPDRFGYAPSTPAATA
ncbi:MAG: DinB family protein [Acidobacteriota bacterium]